jgi:hypothetical protein
MASLCCAQAAAKAASRTAEFATTGDWPDEEEAIYPNSPLERSLSPSASVRLFSAAFALQTLDSTFAARVALILPLGVM